VTNPSLTGLQTHGKFSCVLFGPNIKYHHSRSLGKEVLAEYRHYGSLRTIGFEILKNIISMGKNILD